MGIEFKTKGDWSVTRNFLARNKKIRLEDLYKYGEEGVAALEEATPVDTGRTALSWYYRIVQGNGYIRIDFLNKNLGDGWAPIAILLQMGHATGTGGWVEGRDYINPAIQPVFDRIAKHAWKEVTG